MLTPLRCAVSLVRVVQKNLPVGSTDHRHLGIVIDTAKILQAQIHQALDKNTLELGKFQPMLEDCHLVEDVVRPILSIF